MLHSANRGSAGHRAIHQTVGLLVGIAFLLSAATALAEGQSPAAPATPGAATSAAPVTPAPTGPAPDPAPDLSFEQMGLSIMPEYDQGAPQVLVIIKGSLVNRGSHPISGKDVVFRAPKGSNWTAIAELSSDPLTTSPKYSEMRTQARVSAEGDYEVLALRMTKTVKPGEQYPLQAEFYYPGLEGGPDKSLQLAFMPTYSAKSLLLEIAEPKGAQGFASGLGAGQTQTGGDGLTYHTYTLAGLTAGTPFKVDLTYTRAGNGPSLETQQSSATPASSGSSTNTTAIVIGVLVLAALAGLLLFAGGGRSRAPAQARGARGVREAHRRADRETFRKAPAPAGGEARQRARELLLDGRISEDTYRTLIAELDAEEGR